MKRMILAAVVAALWSGQAAAQADIRHFVDGNKLLSDCTSTVQHSQSYCLGYIVGIADALAEASSNGGSFRGFRSCSPGNRTQGQLLDVVVQWLQRNPQLRHYMASGLVAKALSDAFPCK